MWIDCEFDGRHPPKILLLETWDLPNIMLFTLESVLIEKPFMCCAVRHQITTFGPHLMTMVHRSLINYHKTLGWLNESLARQCNTKSLYVFNHDHLIYSALRLQ